MARGALPLSESGTNEPLAALRTRLEAVPAVEEGARVFVLRDLEELSDNPLALSAGGMLLVSLLDGRRTAAQVREIFKKSTGADIGLPLILELVSALDDAGYLETPAVAARRKTALDAFRASPRRPAVFAGPSYPAETLALGGVLDGYFKAEKGPGKGKAAKPTRAAPLGLIAPHIDFARGGPAYAWAYHALSERAPPDVIIALGVAHVSPDAPWTFTPKRYETPLGAMEVDAELYDDLTAKVWYDPRADEWVHKNEHSLEFQAAWLRHLWGDRTPPWVPILVSSFERFSPDEAPSQIPTLEKALQDFEEVVRAHARKGRRVMVLAGIDLAHVGARFGDKFEVTPALEMKVEAADRESLVDAMALDADGFYRSIVGGGHWRKVCGLSALYTGLRLIRSLEGSQAGRLLTYGQAPDPAGGLVSFASAVFDAKSG
ncbi:MAG: AmmeMemoRadiSam system protein B [Elusimicrobia bacterium GWC2_65_9]|nr:MAG: AmmeMemoRadiSam system protein B [Elusimicrobia bacterium GWA2_66_18]OGR69755.1 MAG: AmmeMemoRadiSam system protein B [Elusimicrobia bacterium GWC2_65_9]